jgi:hypothetical protein
MADAKRLAERDQASRVTTKRVGLFNRVKDIDEAIAKAIVKAVYS